MLPLPRRQVGRSPARRLAWTAGLLALLVSTTARADVVDDAFARGNEAVAAGDLQAAMEASAGRTLQPLFAAWVY